MIWNLLVVIGIVAIDRATKYLAVLYLKEIDTFPIISGALHLTYHENEGAAFGILREHRWIFMSISALTIVFLIAYIIKCSKQSRFICICLAMVAGGGIGNMIDRVMSGYVVDFIDFRLINFAVFNGADSFICIGSALLLIYLIYSMIKEAKEKRV